LVLTKTDLLEPNDLARQCTLIAEKALIYDSMVTPVLMVSTRGKQGGISLLKKEVMKFANKPDKVKEKKKEERDQRIIEKANKGLGAAPSVKSKKPAQKKFVQEKKIQMDQ